MVEKEKVALKPEEKDNQTEEHKFDLKDDLGAGELLLEVEENEKAALAKQQEEEANKEETPPPEEQPKEDPPAEEVKEDPPKEDPPGQAEEKPEYLLDKFKTPEAQARAYGEAEKAKTKAEQEASKLRQLLEEQQGKDFDPDEFYKKLTEKPLETLKPLIAKEVDLGVRRVLVARDERSEKVRLEIADLEKKYSDFKSLRPKIASIMGKMDPDFADKQPNLLEMSYKIARGDPDGKPAGKTKEEVEQIAAKAKEEAEKEIIEKKKSFVEGGGANPGEGSSAKLSTEDEIGDSIVKAKTDHPLFY